MVMCCSNEDHTAVHLISPSQDVAPGTRITKEGFELLENFAAILNPKKKQFDVALPLLKVEEREGKFVSTFDGVPLLAAEALMVSKSTGSIG